LILGGMPMKRAFGTALAVVLPVAVVGVCVEFFAAPSNLHLTTALIIAAGGQVGAWLGGKLLPHVNERLLRILFLGLLLWAGLRNLGIIGGAPIGVMPGLTVGLASLSWAYQVMLGMLAGLTAVFFGIGGGVVVVPGLFFLVGGIPLHVASATSLLAMVPTAALGLRIAWKDQRIERQSVKRLLPTALLLGGVGVLLRNQIADFAPGLLAQIFGAFLLFAFVQVGRKK
ncbi:MAG: TSUP family transporter, partial [Planctomycetes bacterium]|nr:TSUP family transporter [Planctomycetota bacterium]